MSKTIIAPQMLPMERQMYEDGHTEDYKGFVIQSKRDFGAYGFWSPEHRCNINAGWVVCYGRGHQYCGCNAMPGATFAWTLQDARAMTDDFIAAQGEAADFWKLCRARQAA